MVGTVEANIALMRTAFGALDRGDLEACADLVAEDFVANLPGLDEPLHGREIWKLGVQAMLAGFPDLRVSIEDIFGDGDKVAMRLRFEGTHKGPFQGVPATERRVGFTSIEIYRVADGRIAEEWVSPDMMGLMRQISS
ncbi:ester cyclase [Asanoa siamensis]|uniref:Ester cyclase n=1 Tax=Asanoa siamensis TaxID=926357 RepID=A0ABQ4D019_9ACTN|nr:ester cyclase [Asanoa siamensis]GIF76875.1 hypothetical protein Asi02nite_63930 [Asanoa siamensis]